MEATLRGWLYVPYAVLGDVQKWKDTLTHRPRRRGRGPTPAPVILYEDHLASQVLGVPQAFGRRAFPDLEINDQTTEGLPLRGVTRLPSPDHPAVENPAGQRKFMEDMEAACRDHRTFLAHAPTGTGKTVVAARTAAVLGRTTLILVHLERLRSQWIEELQTHLGVPRNLIGVVEGGTCQWEGMDFVVGMVQSVAFNPGRYSPQFYEAFGTLIGDEIHRMGAPVFSQAIWQFPAQVRIGLSATMGRKDGGDKVFFWHMGPVKVVSEQAALPLQVHPVWYDCGDYKLWGTNHGARMKCLSLDWRRNEWLGGYIKRMYDAGRQSLIVGESVMHLQKLMGVAERLGVPREVMGQFTREVHYTDKVQVGDREQDVAKKQVQSASTLDRIKRESQQIYATYGMIKEGIDIPRLDSGMDAVPRSDAAQLIGRVRRPYQGKKSPTLWITPVDSQCNRSLKYFESRRIDYVNTGAEVINA